ncbi:hypothetical protein Tco_0569069 [Tanacetum coccineum]
MFWGGLLNYLKEQTLCKLKVKIYSVKRSNSRQPRLWRRRPSCGDNVVSSRIRLWGVETPEIAREWVRCIRLYSEVESGYWICTQSVPKPERLKRVSALRQPTLTTRIDPEDGIAYIDVPAYPLPAPPVQTPPSPEWSCGLLPISPAHSIVSSPISSPMIPLTVPSPIDSPATAKIEGF